MTVKGKFSCMACMHLSINNCQIFLDIQDLSHDCQVYVDDIAIALKDPKTIVNIMTSIQGFKLKGTSPIKYDIGMIFHCNE